MQATGPDDDMNYQIGILLGAGWTPTDIGRHIGVTPQMISMRKKRDRSRKGIIERARCWTKLAIAKYIEDRLRLAEADILERKKRIHSKGYKLIEKKLDEGLRDERTVIDQETGEPVTIDNEIDATHLKAAEMGIERTEGKALDRKAILSRDEHVYKLEVDGEDLESVLREAALINEMRRKALPAPQTIPQE